MKNSAELKFIYYEKATKCCDIFTLLLIGTAQDKSKMEISKNFVAFSEYMNFTSQYLEIISFILSATSRFQKVGRTLSIARHSLHNPSPFLFSYTISRCTKGDLISESSTLWLQYPQKMCQGTILSFTQLKKGTQRCIGNFLRDCMQPT